MGDIVLYIVNVRRDLEADVMESILDSIVPKSTSAASVLNGDKRIQAKGAVQKEVRESIEKYVKKQDQYLALVSVLLKSLIFRKAVDAPLGQLFQLPRTEHGKPYIPIPIDDPRKCPFSISHQYPFVVGCHLEGLARDLLVGIDAVVFDVFNPRLYDSYEDFVAVFRESFTEEEYSAICILGGIDRIHEFCVRWAVKEAYTKALGVGLGYPFGSFQIVFEHSRASLFALLARVDDMYETRGVVHRKDGSVESESWGFTFYPLKEDGHLLGYTCVAVGMENQSLSNDIQLTSTVKKVLLTELLENQGLSK